ncbi:DsrE family protein [Candidatus Woesearchaeota archaeon]|nr:DsrE family protein [Candidatus Woesearchaeota archaeon]
MNLGIILGSSNPEIAWNAFRFGNAALKASHHVEIFLLNKGVEIESIEDATFNLMEQIDFFLKNNGLLFACGTCLKARKKAWASICPTSNMQKMLEIVEKSDKVLTFG